MEGRIGRKICLLGDPAVGKTSLIKRFVYNRFDDRYISTMGTKISRKTVDTRRGKIVMLIWDILGQNTTPMHRVYYSGAKGVIIVADITREDTIRNVQKWADEIVSFVGEIPIIVAVNKTDLEGEYAMEKEDVSSLLEGFSDIFFTSALKGEGVEDAFMRMAEMVGGD